MYSILNDHILHITCLTANYPDGQKIAAARIRYDRPIDPRQITAASFRVAGRRITGISVNGCEVTLPLDPTDALAGILPPPGRPSGAPKNAPLTDLPVAVRRPRSLTLSQLAPIRALDGSDLPPTDAPLVSDCSEEPVIRDFLQGEFGGIPYNLYVPAGAEGPLPLVLFIHDAGPCGPDPLLTLSQGCGAVCFAAPEWQAKHPCYVLAPQIDRSIHLTSNGFRAAPELETIKALLDDVISRYPVDRSRVYATGQSMGCMASCELNIRYPKLFAASLLVAGQWSPERMAERCADCRFWIFVSEHDARAFPGMNAVTDAMEAAGARVRRYRWDAKENPEALAALAREAMGDDAAVRYTVFCGSSVVPPEGDDTPGGNHTSTWNAVYPIEPVREWLFSCRRDDV